MFSLAVDCGNLENPVGGRVMFFNTTLGAMALYECIEGYRLLEGNVMRVCQHNGNWSGEAIKCISECIHTINADTHLSVEPFNTSTLGSEESILIRDVS